MRSSHLARLGEARTSTYDLRRDGDITDMILQGVSRDGSGLFQAVCLRRSEVQPLARRFETFEHAHPHFAGGVQKAVRLIVDQPDGSSKVYSSMLSRIVHPNRPTPDFLYTFGTGTVMTEYTRTQAANEGSAYTMGGLTGPQEDGITQLIGAGFLYHTRARNRQVRSNYRIHLLAKRNLAPLPQTPAGHVETRRPNEKPFDASFDEIGVNGVARVIYNTTRNLDGDYEAQPTLLSLGRKRDTTTPEELADHLVRTFKVDAVAIRWIDLAEPSHVKQHVFNTT